MKRIAFLLVALTVVSAHAEAFRNLDFEGAQTNRLFVSDPQGGLGATSDLLPGWQLYQGGVLQTNIFLDLSGQLYVSYATVIDKSFDPFPEGIYGVMFLGTYGNSQAYSLVQRGDVPRGTLLLRYRYQADPFVVSLNGSTVSALGPLPSTSTPQEAVYNVSAFAGQNVELRFTTFASIPLAANDAHYIDSIEFVIQAPILNVARAGTNLILSWSASSNGFALQTTDSFSSSNRWQTVSASPFVNGNQRSITTNMLGAATFYRLGARSQ